MKQLEKMASEYAKAGNHFHPSEVDVAHAFEWGFRAAREMAAEACKKVGKIARQDETMTEWSKNAAAFRIMGEEEV